MAPFHGGLGEVRQHNIRPPFLVATASKRRTGCCVTKNTPGWWATHFQGQLKKWFFFFFRKHFFLFCWWQCFQIWQNCKVLWRVFSIYQKFKLTLANIFPNGNGQILKKYSHLVTLVGNENGTAIPPPTLVRKQPNYATIATTDQNLCN